jgi:hypothetical protein
LKYQYAVGNRQHSGSYGWVKGHAGTDRLAELTAGQTVQVHYWRATPNESILLVGSKNVVGALLVILPFLLVCASELQFAFTGQVKWLTIAPGGLGFRIVNPPWGHALALVLFVSGAVHLTLSITILPWRASVISGLLLTFCIVPVAAWLIIKSR